MAELQPFGENLWVFDGPEVRDFGVLFTTRMTVVKLSDGSVWIESPVPAPPDTIDGIAELGPVRYLVAATPRHVWRLQKWHALFPVAELWVPRKSPLTLNGNRLPTTGILGDHPSHAWASDLDQLAFEGNPLMEEILFLHKASRTVILGDLIQRHPAAGAGPIQNALFKLSGVSGPQGGVPLDIRLSFLRRKLARKSLDKLLSWEFDKLVIAHGACVEKDAKPWVERAFRWLKG